MNRKIKFSPGEYYHLYNRGVDKRQIFLEDRDYERFITLLFLCNSTDRIVVAQNNKNDWSFMDVVGKTAKSEPIVSIGAWCLMPNHFHILVKENGDGNISEFMKKIGTAYAMYFNKKYFRTGALFEGKFKAEHISSDRHLKYMLSYIHLNPIGIIDKGWKEKKITDKNKALDFLNNFKNFSLPEYLHKARAETCLLDKASFPDYNLSFEEMIQEWIDFDLPLGRT